MKFMIGSPPQARQPAQALEGWKAVPALSAKRVQTYGLVVSCIGMLLTGILLRGAIHPASLWSAGVILLTALPLHELIHAIATPSWGLSSRTVIGLQGGKSLLLPYATYDGRQPLWRMLLTGLAPTVVLTIVPVLLIQFAPLTAAVHAGLGFLAFFNAAISGGDWVLLIWLVRRLPLWAEVQGNGWELWWKGIQK